MALGNNLKRQGKTSPKKKSLQQTPISDYVISALDFDDELVEISQDEIQKVSKRIQICVFRSGEEEYAIPIEFTKEVVKMSKITPIPHAPEYLIGMTNVRGSVHAILDLCCYFTGFLDEFEQEYLLVLSNEEYKVAIRIPSVPDTLHIEVNSIENVAQAMLKAVRKREYVKGIIKRDHRMIVLLNILDLIMANDFNKNHQPESERIN